MSPSHHYQQIEKAILYLVEQADQHPSLEDIANEVHLSRFHFQRLFQEWSGVSPKQFLQYLNVEHSKRLLEQQKSLQQSAMAVGYSSSSRLHDAFLKIEAMTPGSYKLGGEGIDIHYGFYSSIFGDCIIANTDIGICYIAFDNSPQQALFDLQGRFPKATFHRHETLIQLAALKAIGSTAKQRSPIKLHLIGSAFQLKVWQALLSIPAGHLTSYGDLAYALDSPKAARAIGSAVGKNPIAFLIPCHRVIQASGHFGQYRWGSARKTAIIGWESAQSDRVDSNTNE